MNGIWKMVKVGKFQHCSSCDEECGHIFIAKAFFKDGSNSPSCLNSTMSADGIHSVHLVDLSIWTPKSHEISASKEFLSEITDALNGKMYYVEQFNEGGEFYDDYLSYKQERDNEFASLGIEPDPLIPLIISDVNY